MKKYTSIQISMGMRKKLNDLKSELNLFVSFEKIMEMLLKIKNIDFEIELEQARREVNGIRLYDKLIDGWKIVGYKIKQ